MDYLSAKQLSVGNRIIDSEHKNLLGMTREIARHIEAREVASITGSFDQLENGLCRYFAIEEQIARAVGFDFSRHELAHRNLLDALQQIKREMADGGDARPDGDRANPIHSLRNYLLHHIREDSRPLKIVLDTHLYDFNP